MNLRTILILGALSAFGPLAIDFYLPAFPAMARLRAELSPPVHILPHGAHLVIYRPLAGAVPRIEIIRILHAHQDLTLWLAEG